MVIWDYCLTLEKHQRFIVTASVLKSFRSKKTQNNQDEDNDDESEADNTIEDSEDNDETSTASHS